MTHILQEQWFDAAVEQAYVAEIGSLIETGKLDEAQSRLLSDIADLGSSLAAMCASLPSRIEIDGWDELTEIMAEYEGDPITALHLLFSNPSDLAFEDRETVFEPELDLALYSDALYRFSEADRDTLFAESQQTDQPWYGQGEDIEAYLEIKGMGAFNTALLRHKRQYHFRDQMHALDAMTGENPDLVPLLYIEFVMCALYRAVLFHQAVRAKVDTMGLPGNIPVIVSMDNMKFDISTVYIPKARVAKVAVKPVVDLNIHIKRAVLEVPAEEKAPSLRQFVAEAEAAEKPGFFKRIFGFWRKAA
jgi:hypothetical protein